MADLKFTQLHDEPHESLMRDYLSDRLDRQVGLSEARFREFLAEEKSAPMSRNPLHLSNRLRGWTFGIVGAALAASLAALWAGPYLQPISPAQPGAVAPAHEPTLVNNPIVVEQDVQSQMFDDGAVMIDGNTPVRVIRRHDLQRTRWIDQDQKLQGEQVVPQDHLVYVRMKTY
ncbi:MAG TPA: hypothetical protein VG326_06955 [Tepidisphaeraceae bacterium]|jgi:hypothetical protein|nr:hypothetical protein [Tepidisphaeraceae bacterium]